MKKKNYKLKKMLVSTNIKINNMYDPHISFQKKMKYPLLFLNKESKMKVHLILLLIPLQVYK